MLVQLIAHTNDPEKTVAAAAKLCYSDAHIETLLEELRETIPIIMVSHSLPQALRLAARYAVMSEGKITKTLTRKEIPAGEEEGEKFLEGLL